MMIQPTVSFSQLQTNPNPSKNENIYHPFRIATINVQGLNSEKKDLIIDMMDYNHIQILGISETNLNEYSSKIIYKNNARYKAYFTSNKSRGSGTGILIEKKYDAYVRGHNNYKGRIIYIDLYMKGNNKIRIIQTYINANKKERKEIEDIHSHIKKLIEESKKKNMEVIIMGDFNINYQRYIELHSGNRWEHGLFKFFERNNIGDTIPIINDNPEKLYSYMPKNINQQSSRIDYIWVSAPLLMKIINSKIIDIEHFSTDHKMISASFITEELFGNKQKATIKKQKITKTVFQYDEMDRTEEWKWENFVIRTKEIVEERQLLNQCLNDKTDLNREWIRIREAIIDAATEKIKNKKMNNYKKKNYHPVRDSKLHSDIRFLTHATIIFYKRKKDNNYVSLNSFWSVKGTWERIEEITECYKIESHFISINEENYEWIDDDNIDNYIQMLTELKTTLLIEYKIRYLNYEREQITKFVKERCENYKENQRKMIDSITNREIKHVTIDKVYKEINDQEFLFTEDDEIKRETNKHFQTVAGAVNINKNLNGKEKRS